MDERQKSSRSDRRKDKPSPPAAHLKKLLPESGIVYTGVAKCPQCNGSGYDSSTYQADCCSCSGFGEVLECAGKLFDYREMREVIKTLEQMPQSRNF